ncbi:MAG: substrate-binding domain-containing protein [Prolixibacteraceae bacterium]|jgi:LacI family transcriptional regulator|nr:substrate-binding domain-containing protein [Prolixibacteraceae bacterium]
MGTKRITIQDIARFAKVSAGTVDRVIHNRGKVSADKKRRIEVAINEYNFNPNQLARALSLRNQFTVCTLLPQITSENKYWLLPKQGAEQVAEGFKDFGFSLETFYFSQFDESSFIEQTRNIVEMKPDGVILAPSFVKESILFVKKLEKYKIPYVFIDATIPNQKNISYIGPHTERSGYVAGRLMKSMVRSDDQILVLNIVKGMENSSNLSQIEQGFRNYFTENFQEYSPSIHTLVISSTDRTAIFQELTKFYIKNPNIKGVFVTTSRAHLVAGFHSDHELDIRLIGFDLVEENINQLRNGSIDWIISQSPIQQGVCAVKTLFDLLVNKIVPKKTQYVPLDIIIRENLDFYLTYSG